MPQSKGLENVVNPCGYCASSVPQAPQHAQHEHCTHNLILSLVCMLLSMIVKALTACSARMHNSPLVTKNLEFRVAIHLAFKYYSVATAIVLYSFLCFLLSATELWYKHLAETVMTAAAVFLCFGIAWLSFKTIVSLSMCLCLLWSFFWLQQRQRGNCSSADQQQEAAAAVPSSGRYLTARGAMFMKGRRSRYSRVASTGNSTTSLSSGDTLCAHWFACSSLPAKGGRSYSEGRPERPARKASAKGARPASVGNKASTKEP